MKSIRITISFLFLIAFTATIFAQTKIESVLRKYKNDDHVMALMYSGDKLQSYIKQNKAIKSKLSFVDIVVFKENSDISKKDKSKLTELLQKDGFEMLVNVKSPEGKAVVQGIGDLNTLKKVYVQAQAEGMSVYAILEGDVILSEIAAIASTVDIKELNALKMIK